MKKTLSISSLCFLLVAIVGCTQLDSMYDKETEEIRQFKTNVVYVTNIFETPAITNEVGEVIAPAVKEQVVQPTIIVTELPPIIRTNLVEKPSVQNGIAAVKSVPVPYAGLGGIVAGWLYTLYRSVRNKQINVALVKSVQAGREFLNETPEGQQVQRGFRQKLQESQALSGVLPEVRKLLDAEIPNHKINKV